MLACPARYLNLAGGVSLLEGAMSAHDPRLIPKNADLTEGYMQIQCLRCGSVFRDSDYDYTSAVIDCEAEKAARESGNIAAMPMMVSADSTKFEGS
jgi:hypothetical protein